MTATRTVEQNALLEAIGHHLDELNDKYGFAKRLARENKLVGGVCADRRRRIRQVPLHRARRRPSRQPASCHRQGVASSLASHRGILGRFLPEHSPDGSPSRAGICRTRRTSETINLVRNDSRIVSQVFRASTSALAITATSCKRIRSRHACRFWRLHQHGLGCWWHGGRIHGSHPHGWSFHRAHDCIFHRSQTRWRVCERGSERQTRRRRLRRELVRNRLSRLGWRTWWPRQRTWMRRRPWLRWRRWLWRRRTLVFPRPNSIWQRKCQRNSPCVCQLLSSVPLQSSSVLRAK